MQTMNEQELQTIINFEERLKLEELQFLKGVGLAEADIESLEEALNILDMMGFTRKGDPIEA